MGDSAARVAAALRRLPRTTAATHGPRLRLLAGAALIFLATAIAYWPVGRAGFIVDDDILLTSSPLIRAPDGLYRFWFTAEPVDYWPVSNSSLWLEWRLWGMQPAGYHVTNVALHLASVFLLWIVLRRLSIPGAFLAAMLFAVHPMNVESVAWIAQRKNLLALLFALIAVAAYLEVERRSASRRSTAAWYAVSLLAFVLAALSKISVAVLPLLLMLVIQWRRPLTRGDAVRLAGFAAVALGLVSVNLWFRGHGSNIATVVGTRTERGLSAAAAIWFYLYKALLPLRSCFMYPVWRVEPTEVRWWLPALAGVFTTAALWRYRRAWGAECWTAWAWFCIALLPALGLTERLVVEDHYVHLALVAVVALAGAAWATMWQRAAGAPRWLLTAAAVAVVGVLALRSRQQAALYTDSLTILTDATVQYPGAATSHHNLGYALLRAGRPQEAIAELAEAVRLAPDSAEAHANLGAALAQTGEREAAAAQLRQALAIRPEHPGTYNDLGAVLRESGRVDESIGYFEQALRLQPTLPEAHCNLGKALLQSDRRAEALAHFRAAAALRPDAADACGIGPDAFAEATDR